MDGSENSMAERLPAAALAAEFGRLFDDYRAIADQDPTSNPLLRLALEISSRIQSHALDHDTIRDLVKFLTVEGFETRAAKLGRYTGETRPDHNLQIVYDIALRKARTADGVTLPFEDFRAWAESEVFGIVMTAHPTFEISQDLMQRLSALAIGREGGHPIDPQRRGEILAEVAGFDHGSEKGISLEDEQQLALDAIGHIHEALRRVYRVVLSVAREFYPEDWKTLTPRLITLASWVGFDLDGRKDIKWSNAYEQRSKSSGRMLSHAVDAAKRLLEDTRNEEARLRLELMITRIMHSSRNAEAEHAALEEFNEFSEEKKNDHKKDAFRALATRMHQRPEERQDDVGPLVGLLTETVPLVDDNTDLTSDLLILRAELQNFGLGTSHVHARINATQLHNAIRETVSLEATPDDPRHRQRYITKITELIQKDEKESFNFGSLEAESTSARRLFMTMAQVLKYIDNGTKIRLLIAECESPFTVLTALYYAKLFKIDDKVEICPLFETERALERGSRLIEQLLDNPAYSAYLQTIKMLSVQTGYSDAGRYIGQTPASGSIERLKERVVRLVQRRMSNGKWPDGARLVFFDTHGDSIGRGGHPDGFQDRFNYVASPKLMSQIAESGVGFKQETSFQGGDGYLFFQSDDAAFAALTRILEWSSSDRSAAQNDAYYVDRDTVTEFLTTVKQFQSGLMNDPDYGLLVGTYGGNLLYPSGSRAARRESESERLSRPSISSFRAIPHNAVLQQLGLLANSISGVGEAIELDPAWFRAMHKDSPRLRQLTSLVAYGAAVSNHEALGAYIETLDPELWLARAAQTGDDTRADAFRSVAGMLEDWNIHDGQRKVYRRLYKDLVLLREGLEPVDSPETRISVESRRALILLHAIRVAVIQEIYMLATRIPEFSNRHEVGNRKLVNQVLQLDVKSAVEQLKAIFPSAEAAIDGSFGEEIETAQGKESVYQPLHAGTFTPMLALYDLIPRISIAIVHYIGALG